MHNIKLIQKRHAPFNSQHEIYTKYVAANSIQQATFNIESIPVQQVDGSVARVVNVNPNNLREMLWGVASSGQILGWTERIRL